MSKNSNIRNGDILNINRYGINELAVYIGTNKKLMVARTTILSL